MSGETLRAFKEQYIQQNYIDRAADVVYQKKTKPFSPKRNGWAMLIRIAGWFMIALFLIAAVIVYMLKPGWLSFLFAIGLVLSGFLSMAGIMLLASFFDDVREIRNSIEAYVRSHM